LRFNQLAGSSPGDDDPSSPTTTDEADATRKLYQRAIRLIRDSFEEKTWQAFWRIVVDGQTVGEVAEELNMRPGTVRVAKSRVLKRLREQLGDEPTGA